MAKQFTLDDISNITDATELLEAVRYYASIHMMIIIGEDAAFQSVIKEKAKALGVSMAELNKAAETLSTEKE